MSSQELFNAEGADVVAIAKEAGFTLKKDYIHEQSLLSKQHLILGFYK